MSLSKLDTLRNELIYLLHDVDKMKYWVKMINEGTRAFNAEENKKFQIWGGTAGLDGLRSWTDGFEKRIKEAINYCDKTKDSNEEVDSPM
jgi:hypothetical protein